ncbi:alpha-amylase family glycosyl hydrolase [Synechococcus sp. CS-603]|uniref:alpha-amylase family glycosyl hydrolase n=2 Tax=Synechococcaceae TaxID=1890426 RepID=UPI00223B3E9D|nr:alpha-amylase family glycosyl hydrolase [Synechococcus sp. CS-603]MCT0202970.1 alpha-glucosidase [Synechococcus sp. CS-603]MCT4365001.1 alpha-amylase family glycosyl hydrolase [Candidatus Regnicoccus frigidus MAG-AL1]
MSTKGDSPGTNVSPRRCPWWRCDPSPGRPWWKDAVIYQILPWSFLDTSGTGIGDLQGIIRRFDYVASLGVDAIWLTPFYESPMKDLGYDITDMLDIDPLFGVMKDFETLLSIAHDMGLKVLIDQVWNHTSQLHPWFVESASSRNNPKADWYVWHDPRDDGSPPNNWLSAFMGRSAWQWHLGRRQYYLANFLPCQPELNWHNSEVLEAVLDLARFWLDKGVDGFRIDAVNFFLEDPALRDNPERTPEMGLPDGISPDNPMVRQQFVNSFCRTEMFEQLPAIRALLDEYPNVVSLGEVTLAEDSIALSGAYVQGHNRLHLAYNSSLLQERPLSMAMLRGVIERTLSNFPDQGQCWMVGNHDYGRFRSRWTGTDQHGQPYPEVAYHMMAALLTCLPGALCLYQGDELGLPEARIPADIPEDRIRDSFGKALYPVLPGRDGSRTPMPWSSSAPQQGFTTAGQPWLPIPRRHRALAVDLQTKDPSSLLNTWRRLLHWRREHPALHSGAITVLETGEPLLAFLRGDAEERSVFCLFNTSGRWADFHPSRHGLVDCPLQPSLVIHGLNAFGEDHVCGEVLRCPPYGALVMER